MEILVSFQLFKSLFVFTKTSSSLDRCDKGLFSRIYIKEHWQVKIMNSVTNCLLNSGFAHFSMLHCWLCVRRLCVSTHMCIHHMEIVKFPLLRIWILKVYYKNSLKLLKSLYFTLCHGHLVIIDVAFQKEWLSLRFVVEITREYFHIHHLHLEK